MEKISSSTDAWIALRLSRPEQEEIQRAVALGLSPPDILADHLAILLHLADQHGLSIPPGNIYRDVQSGEFLAQRPDFMDLLKRLRHLPPPTSNERRYLLCMAADRLSRGVLSERAYVQETLDKAAVLVLTPHSTTDLSDPDQTLLWELRGSLARHELQRYKQRVRDTLTAQVRRGHVLSGAACYGYTWDRNTDQLTPHPDKFPILQAILRDALDLSSERLALKYGLSVRTVTNLLRNPKVCGFPSLRHKKGFDPEQGRIVGKVLPRDEWQMPERPGDYPPACTREHWEAIQRAMDRRSLSRDRYGVLNAWCRDIIRFPQAPGVVSLGAWGYRQVLVPTYERNCPGKYRLYYPRSEVHTAAQDAIGAVLEDPTAFRQRLQAYRASQATKPACAPLGPGIETITRQLERRRRQMAELLERETLADDLEERTALAAVRRQSRVDIDRLTAELQQAYLTPAPLPELDEIADELEASAGVLMERWPELPESEKRSFVNGLIEAIEVVVDCEPGRRRYERGIIAVHLREPFRS